MASARVARILKSKSSFSAEQIAAMTDVQGWAWIYANRQSSKDDRVQVCLTGFTTEEKAVIAQLAERAHMRVVKSVTKGLGILVTGDEPGPSKIHKAGLVGAHIMDQDQFLDLVPQIISA